MTLIAQTADGKKVVKVEGDTITVPIGGANQGIVVVTELARIDAVLQVNVKLDPVVDVGQPTNIDLDGPIIGLTLPVAAGTTLTPEVIAIGN
ncbi:MAG: hypothetical protein ACXQTL_05750 [Methanosarcinales archaeon]